MKLRTLLLVVLIVVGSALFVNRSPASAQGGMSKATMKLLMGDLLEAGYSPTVREQDGAYFVTVGTELATAATAAQVNTFATNRGVTARVLVVQFQ